jgi:hypothetical protein
LGVRDCPTELGVARDLKVEVVRKGKNDSYERRGK